MTALAHVAEDSATMLRRNLRHALRYRSMTIATIAGPVVILLLFDYAFGGALGAGIGGIAANGHYIDYIAPGIILVGGRISTTHKDAVTSLLASAGVAGAVVYPTLMGAISLGAGLGVAIGGAGLLCAVGAIFVAVAVRRLGPAPDEAASTQALVRAG